MSRSAMPTDTAIRLFTAGRGPRARCFPLSSRVGKYTEIQNAAAHLHGMMEALKR